MLRTLAVLTLAATSLTAAPAKVAGLLESGERPVKIVCLGDSITGAYYHSGGLRAYPELLELILRRTFPKAQLTVFNAGMSGETTVNGLARLERDVIGRQPDLVTVMFGMNDVVKVPIDEFHRNLVEICTRIRQAGAEVLLCTQNSVTDTEPRPGTKLAVYTEVSRELGRTEGIPVVDIHARFEAIRAQNPLAWTQLASDEIHPNFDGHRLIATLIAQSIAEREMAVAEFAPPSASLAHVRARLAAGQPAKVLAMPPLDTLIGPALTRLHPGADIELTPWPTEGQTLSQIETAAKEVRAKAYDLVLLAVPASAGRELDEAEFHRRYTWVLNWSIHFAAPAWDTIVFPPSALSTGLSSADLREDHRARRVIAGKDLAPISRAPTDRAALTDWFGRWLGETLARANASK